MDKSIFFIYYIFCHDRMYTTCRGDLQIKRKARRYARSYKKCSATQIGKALKLT